MIKRMIHSIFIYSSFEFYQHQQPDNIRSIGGTVFVKQEIWLVNSSAQ